MSSYDREATSTSADAYTRYLTLCDAIDAGCFPAELLHEIADEAHRLGYPRADIDRELARI
ncbi:hypothetical protein N8K70_04035 [Microbacterium betulae]|uniref:Uncharacterized protein n=1 Tax=Microbacterium betulae TaxID=2981139 RepID=A0AA97FIK5_9MICO|nr:hypothetical protein [Microbacterium sp. AB]WOF23861.1 hypothetical protein N8K70_04035 [Microbacterium sp. AB]